MNKKIRIPAIVLFFALIPTFSAKSQNTIVDSSITAPLIYASYSLQFPGGDLGERFGINSSIGGGFMMKLSSNYTFCLEGHYIFGGDVKNKDQALEIISTSQNFVIDKYGMIAEINIYERGFHFGGKIGKIIPLDKTNRNSGLHFQLGGGYLSHKIKFQDLENTTPQLEGDYAKGYDKLSAGLSLTENISYFHMSSNRLLNFSVGIECIQAFTKPLRPYDFNSMQATEGSRTDLFFGLRINWIIPLYRTVPKDFYYY